MAVTQKPGGHYRTTYFDSNETLQKARQQYRIDQTGPLIVCHLPQPIIHSKSNAILGSREFREFGTRDQALLKVETKPCYEMLSVRFFYHSLRSSGPTPLLYMTAVFPASQTAEAVITQGTDDPCHVGY